MVPLRHPDKKKQDIGKQAPQGLSLSGGRKGKGVGIKAFVAAAAPSYGTSGFVRAHVCVLCVSTCACCVRVRSETARVKESSLCRVLRR